MKRNSKGFVPILAVLILIVLGGVGYFAYKNFSFNKIPKLPERTPTCQVNCPDSIPTPRPASTPGWVKYENPEGKFSFEYPEGWFYADRQYGMVQPGLYALTKDEVVALSSKPDNYSYDFHRWALNYDNRKISDYLQIFVFNHMGGDPKVVSKNHNYLGRTDVVTFKYCNTVSYFIKGYTARPYEDCSTTSGYIDMGNLGFIQVTYPTVAASGKEGELAIYKQILSTFKYTN